jgi:ABC-type ATPase with predicted acetyltransferase domain
MYIKINVHSEQLEKIDNFIKSVIMSSAEKLSKTGSSNKEKLKKTTDVKNEENENENENEKNNEKNNENGNGNEKNDEDLSDLN